MVVFADLSARQRRVLGALLGVHSGDSLGASLEFTPPSIAKKLFPNGLREIVGGGHFEWPAGHATDDTDLTRAVLLVYTQKRRNGDDVVKVAADNMLMWFRGDWPGRQPGSKPVDIGGATAIGLGAYSISGNWRNCGAGQGSAGNGSLMRCIPTALFQSNPYKRRKESIEISAITHNDTRCTIACAAYNEIVASLIEGAQPDSAIASALSYVRNDAECPPVAHAIELGQELSLQSFVKDGLPESMSGHASGYVLESLTLAITAVLDRRCITDILSDVVMLGMDADTNAAIAGGLLGARDGCEAIPQAWIEKLQFADEFIEAVKSHPKFSSTQ